jgi:hypothetical protein
MIKFFRKIRYNLMEQNKTGKYLKYAIGEIVLVVIGILLALQVNNWNEDRKNANDITIIKNNLSNEFIQNRNVLKQRIELIKNSLDHANSLMTFMGKSKDIINQQNLDSILVQTLYYGNFNPSNSTILELLQSGKLKLIRNSILKNQLNDWLEMLQDTNEDFKNQDLTANEQLIPYIHNNISTRNLNLSGIQQVTTARSALKKDYFYDALHDFRFENLMINHMVWHTIMLKHYQELDVLAGAIINTLQSND